VGDSIPQTGESMRLVGLVVIQAGGQLGVGAGLLDELLPCSADAFGRVVTGSQPLRGSGQ